ncbi:lipopolysaccharide transport periplasmic protein LptA [Massilia endophytica]|uniref:lipopolysaccharide transport periplasmic protein LptA n=1 Tax=Massilia endophytica TaxID=2899220 RepID=UPI001E338E2A|nr:lipopolysaccharide transport periplasmic protein LptA [Massilia endophytica]UGQ46803.1 lipopolysaccharide transport periplasmic protein LptA [Massilia endophytica]
MKYLIKPILAAAALLAAALPASAEKADSSKPTQIEANQGTSDEVKQTRTLIGDVVLTRGTLIMKAGRALVTTDPQGYQYVTFWGAPGALATFRQKRDGGDLWIEGEAERIEYDNKAEIVRLISKAKVRRLEGVKPTEDVEGPFISYDSRKEFFTVENSSSGQSKPGSGRVRMVIQPNSRAATAPAPAPGK